MLTSHAINYQYRQASFLKLQLLFSYKQNLMLKHFLLLNRLKRKRKHLHIWYQRNRTDIGPSGSDHGCFVCCPLMCVAGSLKWRVKRRSRQDSQQVFLSFSEWQPPFLEAKCISGRETFVTGNVRLEQKSCSRSRKDKKPRKVLSR